MAALQMNKLRENQDVKLAKAISVREALSWLYSCGIQNVALKTDLLLVVQSISSAGIDASYYGLVISDCKLLCNEILGCVISHVFFFFLNNLAC